MKINSMDEDQLKRLMTFNRGKKTIEPLFVAKVNESFILAVYQGEISEYDILIKYRQKKGDKWSKIRTPKHVHWAVDMLIKMYADNQKTKDFLNFLIKYWNETKPIKSDDDRENILNIDYLLGSIETEYTKYEDLGTHGEYSIRFLVLLARLLILQEKTNLEDAYMFRRLLDALKAGEDIYKVISIASHTGGRR